MGTEPHACLFYEVNEVLFRKIFRPVERHMLGEMSQPLLIVVFKHRACLHDETQFNAFFGLAVLLDIIRHPVGQFSDRDRLVNGQDIGSVDLRSKGKDTKQENDDTSQ
jgi:hypothetical protein